MVIHFLLGHWECDSILAYCILDVSGNSYEGAHGLIVSYALLAGTAYIHQFIM